MRKTLFYDTTPHGVVVIYHAENSPNSEWEEWVEYLEARAATCTGLVVMVEGDTGPNSHQRARILDGLKRMPRTTQIIQMTDSAVVRGVLTAVNWVIGRGKTSASFPTKDVDRAFAFLAMPTEHQAEAKAFLHRLQAQAAVLVEQSKAG